MNIKKLIKDLKGNLKDSKRRTKEELCNGELDEAYRQECATLLYQEVIPILEFFLIQKIEPPNIENEILSFLEGLLNSMSKAVRMHMKDKNALLALTINNKVRELEDCILEDVRLGNYD